MKICLDPKDEVLGSPQKIIVKTTTLKYLINVHVRYLTYKSLKWPQIWLQKWPQITTFQLRIVHIRLFGTLEYLLLTLINVLVLIKALNDLKWELKQTSKMTSNCHFSIENRTYTFIWYFRVLVVDHFSNAFSLLLSMRWLS